MPFAHRNKIQAWWQGALFALLASMALASCADRKGSIEAATRLAEKVYPGQLEVIGTQLQKTHYDVIFAVKGDPFTRIRLSMDSDPLACRFGTECEKRLRRAYVEGRHRGKQLKAMNQAFRKCGVPLLATRPMNDNSAYVVELDLGVTDQRPALDRLAACTRTFAEIYGEPIRHNFLIVRLRAGKPAQAPDPVTSETRLPHERRHEPAYWIHVDPAHADLPQDALRIDRSVIADGPVHDKLVAAAQALLKKSKPGAVMRWPYTIWKPELDPQRIDIVRAYMMACSEDREGRCREDLAIRVTYDLSADTLGEITLIEAPEGASGLPDLPRRTGS